MQLQSSEWNICVCVGTMITEWDAGKQMCAEFLKSESDWRAFADQMVAIAVHCGFDGWLLNIENTLQVPLVMSLSKLKQTWLGLYWVKIRNSHRSARTAFLFFICVHFRQKHTRCVSVCVLALAAKVKNGWVLPKTYTAHVVGRWSLIPRPSVSRHRP